MKIQELKNQRVKVSAHSITCKDEYGKTKGIVTGVEQFKKLHPRNAMNYFSKIKSAGLWGNGETDNIYIYNGQIYYLFNLQPLETYEKYFAGKPGFETDTKRYNERKQLAENAATIGTVIPCYILT